MKSVKTNCKYFDGYKPCNQHKIDEMICSECNHYEPLTFRVLIIKVGAAGEVIRNTPILKKLRVQYPDAEITWLTSFPELIPSRFVDRVFKYGWESFCFLIEEKFDLLLNLDKERGSCALAGKIRADKKMGFFYSEQGKILPFNKKAEKKWLTGINDVEMLKNKKHYVEEIFEICGYKWKGEKYILPEFPKSRLLNTDKVVIGITTGTGPLWKTRIPHIDKIKEIIEILKQKEYELVLLGGPDEHMTNTMLSKKYGIGYFGVHPLLDFINIVDNCDFVITPVTMTLHIAIGLEKQVIVLNNIFNKNEFHLYEKGTIIEPDLECLGCYKSVFDKDCPVEDCTLLYSGMAIEKYIKLAAPQVRK